MASAKTFLNSAKLIKKKPDAVSNECEICDRPSGNVYCSNCKSEFKGRIKAACLKHPRVLYFTDYAKCPKCKRDDTLKDGRPMAVQSMDVFDCVCERQSKKYFCMSCGWFTMAGRIRMICQAHPKTLFVQDLPSAACPACKDSKLEELD